MVGNHENAGSNPAVLIRNNGRASQQAMAPVLTGTCSWESSVIPTHAQRVRLLPSLLVRVAEGLSLQSPELPRRVRLPPGTLVFAFASWCGWCRRPAVNR